MRALFFSVSRYIALIAAAVLLAYLFFSPGKSTDTDNTNETAADAEPDMHAKNVSFHQLNPDGSLHYRLRAIEIEQYTEAAHTDMIEPRLHLLSATQPPWDIDSKLGSIQTEEGADGLREEVVDLQKDVHMIQEHPENGTLTLRSEAFTLYPDRQYAHTDQNVTIDTRVGRTIAAGMSANLDTGVLKLTSSDSQRVHTIVLPEQFKKS